MKHQVTACDYCGELIQRYDAEKRELGDRESSVNIDVVQRSMLGGGHGTLEIHRHHFKGKFGRRDRIPWFDEVFIDKDGDVEEVVYEEYPEEEMDEEERRPRAKDVKRGDMDNEEEKMREVIEEAIQHRYAGKRMG